MSKNVREDFIDMLGEESSGWHEGNLNVAAEITLEFSQEDWLWLLDIALKMPLYLQERCVEAVGDMEKDESIPVLTSFLGSKSLYVASLAAIELDNMLVVLPLSFKNRLEEVLAYLIEEGSTRIEEVQGLLDRLDMQT